MSNNDIFVNDYYVISSDFKLISFNETVAKTYNGIKVGDYCYKATMNRDTPCLHCPIAGNSDCDCPIYYDPFYEAWIEAIFSKIGEDKFAVFCRPAKDRGLRIFDELGKEDNEKLIQQVSGHAVNEQLRAMQIEKEKGIKEILELNQLLQDNQNKLEESSAEQESQIEEISQLNEKLSSQLMVIQSMGKAYFTSFYVDLEKNEFNEISNVENVRQIIGVKGDPQKALKLLCDNMVDESTVDELRRFTDLTTINERLKDKEVITCDYIGKVAGWCQLYIIAGDRNDNGTLKTMFVASRVIHDEKAREEKQRAEIKEAKEEAERANAAKTTFLFNMSHDIRTPMNAIMGFRDLLEKYQDDPQKRADYLHKIEDASVVLLSIINNVLEMARIEKGIVEVDETAWSVEQFNDTIFSVFNEMMVQKDIIFEREIKVKHNYVFCDPIKLREVFLNILSNAYKYTNPGGRVKMLLEELPCDKEGYGMYRTTISDTGIGMSEEFLPYVFEEFSRENNSTDAKIEGTGLGMPIVKRLVEYMKGNISVTSKKGVGTTFVVEISHRIAEKANLVEHDGIELDPKLFAGKRVLLAEDNDFNAEIAMVILEEAGFVVDRAEDGAVCVDKIVKSERGYYDIILMDIQMPKKNGYEATREIRAVADAAKANIPILAITANAFAEDKMEALKSGMNGHLSKPIDIKMLMKEMAGILG